MSELLSAPTTPAAAPPALRRAKRPLKPPTERDLYIYKLVKIQLREQWEVAYDHQIDRSRVSQIIKRVDRWLAAGGDPADPVLRDHAAQQRLDSGMLKLRLARAVELASRALEFQEPIVTTKKRFQGSTEVWREETARDVPKISLSALRTLLDASSALQKLNECQKPPTSSQPYSDDEILRVVFDLLLGLRHRAESQGHIPPNQNHRTTISQTLSTLLGPSPMNPTQTNALPTTLNLEPGTLNSPSNTSPTAQREREAFEPNALTTSPQPTCSNALNKPASEVSTSPDATVEAKLRRRWADRKQP
ncbi:MAG TPA: hypothetical protein VGI40_28405 [Pirellulaceae bacterium]|jgi:hypothetical protein